MANSTKKPRKNRTAQDPLAPRGQNPIYRPVMDQKDSDEELFSKLNGYLMDSENTRTPWSLKRATYYRMRMRLRKEKSFPFPGCSNLRMPTLEKYIRKAKSALFNIVWGIRPHAIVMPEPNGNPDTAFKLEHYIDWLLEQKAKFARPLMFLIDKMLEKGFAFVEPIWKMEDEQRKFEIDLSLLPDEVLQLIFSSEDEDQLIEEMAKLFDIDMSETVRAENTESINKALEALRAGNRKVNVTVFDETYNNVAFNVLDPEDVRVPTDSTLDPQSARFIAIDTYESWNVVKMKANRGIYDKSVVDDMKQFVSLGTPPPPNQGRTSLQTANTSQVWEDMREGIERVNNASHSVKIVRMYAWYDLDGDGIEERNVFILAPEFKKVLAKFPFTYAHRKWPLVRFDAEVIADRWYSSRGYPELLEDIIKEIDTQHNQKIDQQTIRNTPMFAFRSGIVNPRMVKFVPGQGIPVPGTIPLNDAITVLRNESSNAEYSYRDEEMLLKGEVQELLGQIDYSMQSQINRRQPRTASEVSGQAQAAATVFSLDVLSFAESFSEMLTQAVQLTQQFLPQQVWFSIAGEGDPIQLSREEIQGGYQVRIRGNDVNTNPAKRLEMCQARFSFLGQPAFMMNGIVTPNNLYMYAKKYLQETGEFNWKAFITPPQPPPPPAPPPAIEKVKVNYDDLTDAEQAQVLMSGGIKPDFEGRALERQQQIMTDLPGEQGEPVEQES